MNDMCIFRMQQAHPDQEVTPEKAKDELLARACENMFGRSETVQELLAKMTAKEKKSLSENLKAQNGKPVLTVLDLRPTEKNLVIADMQKISSVYSKTGNGVTFIKESEVLYAEKTKPLSCFGR